MNDQDIVTALSKAFDDIGPTPQNLLDAAFMAIGMLNVDDQLADLVFDSWRQDQMVAMRDASSDVHLLTFSSDDGSLDLEVRSDGTLVGQVERDELEESSIATDQREDRRVSVQSVGTDVLALEVDSFGRFRSSIPPGPFRLEFFGFRTPWIAH